MVNRRAGEIDGVGKSTQENRRWMIKQEYVRPKLLKGISGIGKHLVLDSRDRMTRGDNTPHGKSGQIPNTEDGRGPQFVSEIKLGECGDGTGALEDESEGW